MIPTWDEYFVSIAKLTSERSNCIKRKVGAIIVKNNRILSLGYNGTPSGIPNCYEGGCKRCYDQKMSNVSHAGKDLDLCICLHAEENALLFVSQKDIEDSTIYVTLFPCISCLKKIVQCKIKRIVYISDYSHELQETAMNLIYMSGIIVEKF